MPISRYIEQPLDLSYGVPRTPGVHLSGILKVMAKYRGIKSDGPGLGELIATTLPEKIGTTGSLMRCSIGYALEEWLGRQLERRNISRPGELSVDGILMTPDGIELLDDEIVLHEIKATFTSSRTPATDNPRWMWQCAGYMHGIAETYGLPCNRVIMHPFYMRGDYKGIDPQYLPQEVVFEGQEIRDVWGDVMRFKGEAEAE